MQVGKSRLYTPSVEDVGSVMKVEVVVIDASRGVRREAGHTFSVSTTRVKVHPRPYTLHPRFFCNNAQELWPRRTLCCSCCLTLAEGVSSTGIFECRGVDIEYVATPLFCSRPLCLPSGI